MSRASRLLVHNMHQGEQQERYKTGHQHPKHATRHPPNGVLRSVAPKGRLCCIMDIQEHRGLAIHDKEVADVARLVDPDGWALGREFRHMTALVGNLGHTLLQHHLQASSCFDGSGCGCRRRVDWSSPQGADAVLLVTRGRIGGARLSGLAARCGGCSHDNSAERVGPQHKQEEGGS